MTVDCLLYRNSTGSLLRQRKVTKLITPGTYMYANDVSSAQTSNYLLCITDGPEETLGLSWIDIAAQDFQVYTLINIIHLNNLVKTIL